MYGRVIVEKIFGSTIWLKLENVTSKYNERRYKHLPNEFLEKTMKYDWLVMHVSIHMLCCVCEWRLLENDKNDHSCIFSQGNKLQWWDMIMYKNMDDFSYKGMWSTYVAGILVLLNFLEVVFLIFSCHLHGDFITTLRMDLHRVLVFCRSNLITFLIFAKHLLQTKVRPMACGQHKLKQPLRHSPVILSVFGLLSHRSHPIRWRYNQRHRLSRNW